MHGISIEPREKVGRWEKSDADITEYTQVVLHCDSHQEARNVYEELTEEYDLG